MENVIVSKRPNQIVNDLLDDQPVQKNARMGEEQSSNALSKEESSDELENSLVELSAQLDDSMRKTEEALGNERETARQISSLIEVVRVRRNAENGIVNELTSEISALKDKFEAAKSDEDIAKRMHFELAAKNFTLKEDLDQSRKREEAAIAMRNQLAQDNVSLKIEMDDLRKREEAANHMKDDLSNEYSALECELDEARLREEASIHMNDDLSREISALKEELEKTRGKAGEDGARIADLTRKLAECEGQLEKSMKGAERLLSMQQGLKRVMNGGASPNVDIFQFCFPSTDRNSISIGEAQSQLRSKLNECGYFLYQRYCRNNGGAAINLHCAYCQKTIKHKILDHFLSQEHADNVKMVGATVSFPAVQHWLQHLQQAVEKMEEVKALFGRDSDSD